MAHVANQMELGLQDRAIRKLEAVTYQLVDALPRADGVEKMVTHES